MAVVVGASVYLGASVDLRPRLGAKSGPFSSSTTHSASVRCVRAQCHYIYDLAVP